MNNNLVILDEVKAVIQSLDELISEKVNPDGPREWEMTAITSKGPAAWVRLYVPRHNLLPTAAVLAEHSSSWEYLYPLQFDVDTFATKVTITLRELPGRNNG